MSSDSSLFRYFVEGGRTGLRSVKSIQILLAWLISIVFHPLLVPTYLHGIVFKYCTDLVPLTREVKIQMLSFIFLSTYLIPSLAAGFLWVSGLISSLSMEKKSERLIPLTLTGIIYTGVSYIFLDYLETARLLGLFMGSIAFAVGITALITYFWKISSHMMGIGGLIGFIIAAVQETHNMGLQTPLIFSILVAGAVASSRFLLKAHTVSQLVAGFFLGMMISWSAVHFFV